ncbi:hypothetical protein GCM10011321_18740 [Youhaiella tibetensis]|uniref:Alkaline ceramidase n=1 Tax=Paradevosia tibetensis TaxID=1447062 RepID=A0A5B9DMX8_9HYPH|nr:alkaline ceramidase [Youhaiella tibetensis]QEE20049.1 alkaline ceramidase [Youhaiella tibetensis]GGF27584.1 hypothetical protein GCM10011321_18740 [Youhaiella tibetensis]
MIRAGAAIVDITPPAGLLLSGFAARSEPAIGAHDPLTVRAVAVNDTAIVVADVIGLHGEMTARVRRSCSLPDDNVIIAALHNHGGPVSMRGRLSLAADPDYLARLEAACVEAIDRAVANQRPARLFAGLGNDPDVARNRRHAGGTVDPAVPVLRIRDVDGAMIAVVASYACHPVVLGADNRLWTADYPHFVRRDIEAACPGAVALFVTGCTGDANTGHSAHASVSLAANSERTFANSERIGGRIAAAALAAPERELGQEVDASNEEVVLTFERREARSPEELAAEWRNERESAGPARSALLGHWIEWAQTTAREPLRPMVERVTVLNWGGLPIVGLPGEIFAETALHIRAQLPADLPAIIADFAEDNPGYISPASEYSFGGYEVDEAHRYYGQPAGFAAGSAEALAGAAIALLATQGLTK